MIIQLSLKLAIGTKEFLVSLQVVWSKTDLPIRQACTAKGSWDLCFASWQGNLDAALTASRFYDDIGGVSGWTSPEYLDTLSSLRTAQEDTAVRSLAAQLQQRAYDDSPAAVRGYGVDIQAIRSDMWTGCEGIIDAAGGLFGIGSAAAYMQVARIVQAEE